MPRWSEKVMKRVIVMAANAHHPLKSKTLTSNKPHWPVMCINAVSIRLKII